MAGLPALALVMLQSDGGRSAHDPNIWGVVFLGFIALCMGAQALGICVAGWYAIKTFKKIEVFTNAFDARTTPLIEKTTAVVEELVPKVRTITTNVEEVTYTVREQVTELSATLADLNRTVRDANARTRAQVSRVDGLVSEALTTTQEVSKTVQEGIRVPARQLAGILAGAKAAVETLIARSPFPLKRKPEYGDTDY